MRATAVALHLLVVGIVGGGVSPYLVGHLSDSFAPTQGAAALGSALLIVVCTTSALAGVFYLVASRWLREDLSSAELSRDTLRTFRSGGAPMSYDLSSAAGSSSTAPGSPRRRVDVGVARRPRRRARARLDAARRRREIDADGLIVAPGIVDAHTHYDPQITFDPYATMSCFHGVTTVVARQLRLLGRAVQAADRDFLSGIFARVENMDPIALTAITWDEFETFREFLASRARGKLGVNFGCYVGHSNLRRWVMGDDASDAGRTADEIDEMRAPLREAMAAGAAGLSSSRRADPPRPRRPPGAVAPRRPRRAARARRGARSTRRRHRSPTCPRARSAASTHADEDFLIELGVAQRAAGRHPGPRRPQQGRRADRHVGGGAVEFLDRATAAGAPVFSMLIARPFDRPVVIDETNLHYSSGALVGAHAQAAARRAARAAARPAVARRAARRGRALQPRSRRRARRCRRRCGTRCSSTEVVDRSPSTRSCRRSIADIAAEHGVAPADAMLDLALAEDLATRVPLAHREPGVDGGGRARRSEHPRC